MMERHSTLTLTLESIRPESQTSTPALRATSTSSPQLRFHPHLLTAGTILATFWRIPAAAATVLQLIIPRLRITPFRKNDDDIEHGEGTRGAGPNFEQQGQADEKISDIDSGVGVGEVDQGPHGEVVLLNGSKALVEGLFLPTESVGTSASLSADTAGSNSTVAHGPAGAARGTDSTSQLGE